MKVQDLLHLADIWRLVEKDPGTKEVYLDSKGARLMGMHIEASRRLALPLDKGISVSGPMLLGTLGLLTPTDTITIKQTPASLVLSAGGRRALITKRVVDAPKPSLAVDADFFDGTKLRDEVAFLRGCVAGGVLSPVLTGIHFRKDSKDQTILEATDAERRTGRSVLTLPFAVSGQVVPSGDLSAVLALLDKKIAVKFTKAHMLLRDKTTRIKLSLLQGNYPDLTRFQLRSKYKYKIALSKAALDAAVRAAILFDNDRIITLVVKDKTASLLVRSQETGGFRQPVGRCSVDDVEIRFDAHWLDATQFIGDEITLYYDNPKAPVLFSGKRRLLWISPIYAYRPDDV